MSAQHTANTLLKETKHQGCEWTEVMGREYIGWFGEQGLPVYLGENVTVAPSFGQYLRKAWLLHYPLSIPTKAAIGLLVYPNCTSIIISFIFCI